MKQTYQRNLQFGFGISLILLILSSAASYFSIQNLLESSRLVRHTDDVILNLENVISTLKDAETGQRGFVLTGDYKFLEPYTGTVERASRYVAIVKDLTLDNPAQQRNASILQNILTKRLTRMQRVIDFKREGRPFDIKDLDEGKLYMDSTRRTIDRMQSEEQRLLKVRTAKLENFSTYTPLLIILAAVLSIIITLFFAARIRRDFEQRALLQQQLEDKDAEITSRINIIQNIANKISGGEYSVRVQDDEKDGLGSLAYSLNKMASSLETAFTKVRDNEWLQIGIAEVNKAIVGEKDLQQLAKDVLETITPYTLSQTSAIYFLENGILQRYAGYGIRSNELNQTFRLGEGIVGQCGRNGRYILAEEIPEDNVIINFAVAQVKPANILAYPIMIENELKGVLALGSTRKYNERKFTLLQSVSQNIGLAVLQAENRRKLQELLHETQAQSEELQVQHSEMENLNTELETQAEKLQASEEELRVQQEELLQVNQELEERSRLLEEKNQLIVERNLEIQRNAEQLALSTKYKSEFLANMSHELRTPLNSILLLSRLLSENNDANLSKDQVEYATVIESSGKGLLSLIDEILDLSKIESGKMELENAFVPVQSIVDDMRALFQPIAKDRGLQLRFEVNDDVPAHIETDKMRLEQVLKNLLSNALKFTSRGVVALSIKRAAHAAHCIAFSVKDSGIGIPKEKQALIFEAFQQADGSTRRKFGGTGLGLSISRELSRLLGGDISVESEAGEGSTFTIVVPENRAFRDELVPEQETPIQQTARAVETIVQTPLPAPDSFVSGSTPDDVPDDRETLQPGDKTILIVEDDTAFAKALLEFTHRKGYKALVAVRGDIGVQMAQQYLPIGILLDIQLPVLSGWQVMEQLKGNPRTRHIPVHIMSSHQVKKESLTKGAIDFINKPFAFEQMDTVFKKLEFVLNKEGKKVLIVEENPKHAKALAYFLDSYNVSSEIQNSINASIDALQNKEVDCVILDMGIPDISAYSALEELRRNQGLEDVPVIVFTGKSLSKTEEQKIRQYADTIVVKTAHSYQRILDEVSLFLHLMEEQKKAPRNLTAHQKLGALTEVLKNKTVIIADDDVRNIFSLTKALENHKMNVLSATDGNEALRVLNMHPHADLVLMDMMMPEKDGYEAITELRKDSRFRNLPVIAVTAKAMTGDREKCIQAGASDYISKPVDIDQLLSLLRVWLYDKSI